MDAGVYGGGVLDPDGAMERLLAWKSRIDKLAAVITSLTRLPRLLNG